MDDRVNLEAASIEFTTEGEFESHVSKEYSDVEREIDVFYQGLYEEKEEHELPITIFSQSLSPLQAIVKHLKESLELTFSDIARLTNRDPRTIWTTYDKVKEDSLEDVAADIFIPVSVFQDRDFSTLEALVNHLLGRDFSVSETAAQLGKDYQTVWTVKRRIAEKGGGADE